MLIKTLRGRVAAATLVRQDGMIQGRQAGLAAAAIAKARVSAGVGFCERQEAYAEQARCGDGSTKPL